MQMREKLIVGGSTFFGFGLLWGWAVTGDKLEAKMKSNQRLLGDIIRRKTEELERAHQLLLNRDLISTNVEEEYTKTYTEQDEQEYHEISPADKPPAGESEEDTRERLASLISTYTDDEDVINGFTKKAQRAIAVQTPPYVISKSDYAWDEDGDEYSKSDLTWYPTERILLDDEKDLVEDVDILVGYKNLERFGDESDDPDVVFIRNDSLMMDFEVTRETEEAAPIHVQYGLGKEEYEVARAGDTLRFRPGD